METGRKTSESPHSFTPSVKHLVWALLAGTVLVISGTRDNEPPQPSAAQAFAAPSATPTATPTAIPPAAPRSTGPVRATPGTSPAPAAPEHAGPAAPPTVRPVWPPMATTYFAPVPRTVPARTVPARTLPARTAPVAAPAVGPLPPSDPVRLRIPALRVDAPMTRLGLDAAGALRPPPDDNPLLAGWYGEGTSPGSTGTAITAGHVDTRLGPGVFQKLGLLTKGATVEIVRADRRTAVFTVDAVEVYDKKGFPDKKVYSHSERPELRVITCGGSYSKKTGYRSNVVVYATLTAVRS